MTTPPPPARHPPAGPGPPDAELVLPERNVTVTGDGIEWHQVHLLRVAEPGSYQLRCTGADGYTGVGEDLPPGLLTQVAGLLGGAFAAALAAVVTTIVVSRKRRAERRCRAGGWCAAGRPSAPRPARTSSPTCRPLDPARARPVGALVALGICGPVRIADGERLVARTSGGGGYGSPRGA